MLLPSLPGVRPAAWPGPKPRFSSCFWGVFILPGLLQCIYIYIHNMYVYKYVYVYVYVYLYVIVMYVCMSVCMYVCTYVRMYVCM